MNGVLLIDKPSGPTSHDVVRLLRRSTRERRIGHTGTLDPRATGLLPLVLGRATRLASRLSARQKTYEAAIHLGTATTTDDAEGEPIGPSASSPTDEGLIRAALDAFRGPIDQVPPSHSAKKIDGERAYARARRDEVVDLPPVSVTVHELTYVGRQADTIHIVVSASSGFYVRSLARDVGIALGCGGHLASLRRTWVGPFDVRAAIALEEALAMERGVDSRLLAMADALPDAPAVHLNDQGLARAMHGNPIGPEHLSDRGLPSPSAGDVRLLGPGGDLVAVAHSRGGALHPVVVVG